MPKRAGENPDENVGYDLFSTETVTLNPMERRAVSTGIAIEIPRGFYGRIAPRSGLAVKNGIDVLAGTIDSGYKGEVKVVLINLNVSFEEIVRNLIKPDPMTHFFGSNQKFEIRAGDRIAQLIIEPAYKVEWKETNKLNDSARGVNGFGSSGN